jgi:hypothetical protein
VTQAVTSLPRPILYALVGAAAVLALLVGTRHRGTSSPTTTTPAPANTKPANTAGTHAKPTTEHKKPSSAAKSHPASGSQRTLPAPVQRALSAHKVVVLLFWNPRSSDDRSVRQAFASVSGHGGAVAKFTDTLGNVARYTRVTGSDAAVTQTPTVVVVDRKGNGRFVTGFQDSATVEQLVVDALK